MRHLVSRAVVVEVGLEVGDINADAVCDSRYCPSNRSIQATPVTIRPRGIEWKISARAQ